MSLNWNQGLGTINTRPSLNHYLVILEGFVHCGNLRSWSCNFLGIWLPLLVAKQDVSVFGLAPPAPLCLSWLSLFVNFLCCHSSFVMPKMWCLHFTKNECNNNLNGKNTRKPQNLGNARRVEQGFHRGTREHWDIVYIQSVYCIYCI